LTKVPIAFICDRNYIIPTAVAITSLVYNKKPDTCYDIYVITIDLSETDIEKFYEFKGNKTDVHVIKVSLEKFEGMQQYGLVSIAAYLKCDLPELIPHQDKLLYLDGDIVIQKDLSGLFEIDIKDCYAGVVKGIGMIDNHLNLKNYFNSGVMLLNLKLMRENNVSGELLNIGRSAGKFMFMDQDCFNILFNNKVKFLPVIYNCTYNLLLKYKDTFTPDFINSFYDTNYLSMDDIKKDSYIVHFVSYEKPWIYSDAVYAGEWDEYFKKSPFKFHKLRRKSKKIREFMSVRHLTKLPYSFFIYWRYHGFKFAMDKVKIKLFKRI
jgi:lipopolysaccharide biosynthesis glycosyltransferase